MNDTLGALKKTNPLALLLMAALSILCGRILYSGLPLDHKTTLFILSVALVLVAVTFETYRISWQEDVEEEALRRQLFGR